MGLFKARDVQSEAITLIRQAAWHVSPSQCSLVSFAASDPDEFLDATGISEGFGVLHVLGDDFVQRAADGRYRVVWHGLARRARGPGGPTAGGVIVAAATTSW